MFSFLKRRKSPPPFMGKPSYTILKDEKLNSQLIANGYIVLPMLNAEEVLLLEKLYKKWHPTEPEFFYKSYFSDDMVYKMEVEDLIKQLFAPKLDEYFVNYETLGGMYVVKPNGEKGKLPPHQDWTLVDEKIHWSLNCWCPLIDAVGENGNIQMLPKSHFFMETVRGSGVPEYYCHLLDDVTPFLVDVPIKAGDAVFFYHSIIHCSTINTKQEARVTVNLSLVEKNAPIYYYFQKEQEQQIDKYRVDTEFYMNYASNREQAPQNMKEISKSDIVFYKLSRKEFLNKVNG